MYVHYLNIINLFDKNVKENKTNIKVIYFRKRLNNNIYRRNGWGCF